MLERIISGAQIGADRGGLDAALERGLPIGGWVPRGRRAEDGTVPEKYAGLLETPSADYGARTVNVAGQRESKAPGIQAEVAAFVGRVLSAPSDAPQGADAGE